MYLFLVYLIPPHLKRPLFFNILFSFGMIAAKLVKKKKTNNKQTPNPSLLKQCRGFNVFILKGWQFSRCTNSVFISMVISYSTLVQAQGLSNNTSFFSIFNIGCALFRLRSACSPHSTILFNHNDDCNWFFLWQKLYGACVLNVACLIMLKKLLWSDKSVAWTNHEPTVSILGFTNCIVSVL